MTNDQTIGLVLRDGAGDYYLVPRETLERGRVPAEQRAEVEEWLAESEVSGYSARNLYEVATTIVWAVELGANTIGKVLADMAFEASYGSPDSPTVPA
jgi:hypothetical protein